MATIGITMKTAKLPFGKKMYISCAETYAKENGIPFEEINKEIK